MLNFCDFIQDYVFSTNHHLNFFKAFVKVGYQKLLLQLHNYGIRGPFLKWIQAFLSSRTQTVVLENEKSDTVAVTSGDPSGFRPGPNIDKRLTRPN